MNILALDIAISFLVGLFAIFVLSCIGFIFHIPINICYSIFAVVVSGSILFFRLRERNLKFFQIFMIFLVLFVLLAIFGYVQYKVADFSYDGCTYHQAMIISLKWGWNPIYDNVGHFLKSQMSDFKTSQIFIQSYLKCYEILAANIYMVFNKIELVKVLKPIFALTTFLYTFYSLSNFRNISKSRASFLAFLFTYNPVCIYQFFTNYNDDAIYYFFIILIFSFINYVKENCVKTNLLIMFIATVMLVNFKFSTLVFVLVVYLCFLIAYKSKDILKIGLLSCLLILICTINPFYTNLASGKSLFYPREDGKINDFPVGFDKKGHFEKIFISIFSSASVNSVLMNETIEPELKLPFTINNDSDFRYPDMRISGFGYFYSGILLLAVFQLFALRFQKKEDKKIFLSVLMSLLVSSMVLPVSWWARYVPQMWAIPVFICAYSLAEDKNKNYVYVLMFIIFINSLIINIQNFSHQFKINKHYMELMQNAPDHMGETFPVKILERNR